MDNLQIYRRNLPHWRLDGAVYFVTWRLYPGCPVLHPDERTKIVEILCHFEKLRYLLIAYVVMDDHVHVVLQPAEGVSLQQIVQAGNHFQHAGFSKRMDVSAPCGKKNRSIVSSAMKPNGSKKFSTS